MFPAGCRASGFTPSHFLAIYHMPSIPFMRCRVPQACRGDGRAAVCITQAVGVLQSGFLNQAVIAKEPTYNHPLL